MTESKTNENEQPEIYALSREEDQWKLSRREFLAAASIAAAGIAASAQFPARKVAAQDLETLCREAIAHEGEVLALDISPDGRYFISSGADRKMKKWNLPYGGLEETCETWNEVSALKIVRNADETHNLLCNAENLSLYTLPYFHNLMNFSDGGYGNEISHIAATNDGSVIAVGCTNGFFYLCTLKDDEIGKIIWTQRAGDSDRVRSLDISSDGKLLLTSRDSDLAALWSCEKEELIKTIYTTANDKIAFMPGDAQFIGIPFSDIAVEIRNIHSGELTQPIDTNKAIRDFAVSPDGSTAFFAIHSTIEVWSLTKNQMTARYDVAQSDINCLAISGDGKYLISGAQDGSIHIWNILGGKLEACPMDLNITEESTEGIEVDIQDPLTGNIVTQTLPCGSPIPAGAVCTCNCVAGAVCSCDGYTQPAPCSCNTYVQTVPCPANCTCNSNVGSHYWYPN